MSSIDLTIQNVSIQPIGGMKWLKIDGYIKSEFDQQMNIISGSIQLTIQSTRFPPIPITSSSILTRFEKRGSTSLSIDYPIDPTLIHDIELSRTDTTVDLTVNLHLMGQRNTDKSIEQVYVNTTSPYTIKTKQWMGILESLNLNRRWNITIINPSGALAPAIEDSEQYFKDAYEALISGRYDIVLVNCRKILENIWSISGDKTQGQGVWPKNGQFDPSISKLLDESHQSQSQDHDYSEKMYHYIEATFKLMHHGAHAGYIVSRQNAELCYSSAALILQIMCIPLCKK
jgi:hypothetical protein